MAQKLVGQELQTSGNASNLAARVGTYADAFFKAQVRQAISDGQLPSTIRVSPTLTINTADATTARSQVDMWDSATGEAWDVTTVTDASKLGHEKYVGMTMPDGTAIRVLHYLVYRPIPD